MEKKFSEEESLLVIRQMIEQVKGNMEKGDGKYFILWGYIIAITSLVHFLSYTIGGEEMLRYSWLIWVVPCGLGTLVSVFLSARDSKRETIKTYVGFIIHRIWMGSGITIAFIWILFAGHGFLIYLVISLVYTLALFLSASAFRMRWMYIPVIVCVMCIVSYKLIPGQYFPLPMAVMMISGNIVPGHVINYLARKDVQRT